MGPATPSTTSPLTAVERSLRDSLLVSEFRDVYLYAFSRRTILPDGTLRINHPLPVVTISSILNNTESFSELLRDPGAVQQQASSSEYDYESDSDLDELEELQVEDLDASPTGPGSASAEGSPSEGNTKDRTEDPANNQAVAKGSAVAATQRYLQVPVPNIAYRTLRACIFYLYTGKINFLPLISSGAPGRQLALFTPSNNLAPPCSPKSMYRLADLYGLTELRDLAYNEVVWQLRPENLVEEAFSSFFVRYDRLREHAISYLCQNYSTSAVQESLPNVIQRIALGEMPHASRVLHSLLGLRMTISSLVAGRTRVSRAVKPARPRVIAGKAAPPSKSLYSMIDWSSFLQPKSQSSQPVAPIAREPLPADSDSLLITPSPRIPSSSGVNPSVTLDRPCDEAVLSSSGSVKKKKALKKKKAVASD